MMLDDQQILRDIHAMPPEKQAEILDFIAFVKTRGQSTSSVHLQPSKPFRLNPALHSSGFKNTSIDHDAIIAQAIQEKEA